MWVLMIGEGFILSDFAGLNCVYEICEDVSGSWKGSMSIIITTLSSYHYSYFMGETFTHLFQLETI